MTMMMMMMKKNKVLLPRWNHSDKRSPRIETTGKSETVTLKLPHHYSLPSGPFTTHQFLLSPHHIPNFPFQAHILHFGHPVKILKMTLNSKFHFISITMSKSSPLHLQNLITKYHKTFFQTKKKNTVIKPKLCHSSTFFTGPTLLKTFSFPSVICNWHFFLNSHSTLLAWLGPLFCQSLPSSA